MFEPANPSRWTWAVRVYPGQATGLVGNGLPARGSVVELDLALPDLAGYHTVHAYVVHLAPSRGAGIQFVGASEAFNSDLDRYLAHLAR